MKKFFKPDAVPARRAGDPKPTDASTDPTRLRAASTAGTTTRLLVACLVALTTVPPAATLIAGASIERHGALDAARVNAKLAQHGAIAADIVASPDRGLGEPGHWHEWLGHGGQLLVANGDAVARDGLAVSATAPVAGHPTIAAVRVRASLSDALLSTAAAALASGLAALLFWALLARRSVGALRKAEGRLRAISVADTLTGLLNRAGLHPQLQRSLDRTSASPSHCAGLLLVDLDRFRLINESYGQVVGDELLRVVAQRVRTVLRRGDCAARLGGDQFVIHVRSLAGPQAATVMARNLLRATEQALQIGQREAQVSVSIGIALTSPDVHSPDQWLANADAAMRAAKSGGGSRYRMFDASMVVDYQHRLDLDMALRRALQAEEFALVYQPIMSADGERIQAVEALLRWHDPRRGVVSPAEFIPVLEQTGLIVPVGQWVLREACRRVQSWVAHGASPVTLSVNVSPMQFAEAAFVDDVMAALEATGFAPDRLQLEVTEGLLLDPTPASLRKMDALVDAGVRLAVDDFGMGYSSLAYLKRFRLHSLKIDRMFVRDVPAQRQDTAIVRAIIELAHALELHVTAEGVEHAQQHAALMSLGCDSMQGFLFARPMTAEAMREMLSAVGAVERGDTSPSDWSTTMAAQLEMPSVS
jgi:diguanylate cyclase (GGDEF)-like protein